MVLLDYRIKENETPPTVLESEYDGNGVIEMTSGHIYPLPEGLEVPEIQDDWWYVDRLWNKNDEDHTPTYTRRKDIKK